MIENSHKKANFRYPNRYRAKTTITAPTVAELAKNIFISFKNLPTILAKKDKF